MSDTHKPETGENTGQSSRIGSDTPGAEPAETGRPSGVQRVCQLWAQPRSTIYPRELRAAHPHDGTITTAAPNVGCGTDGVKVFTLDESWIWVFVAVEHWNAERVGWHGTTREDRHAALDPLAQGLASLFGGVNTDAARGLVLRMAHGSQYLSDHFVHQVHF